MPETLKQAITLPMYVQYDLILKSTSKIMTNYVREKWEFIQRDQNVSLVVSMIII